MPMTGSSGSAAELHERLAAHRRATTEDHGHASRQRFALMLGLLVAGLPDCPTRATLQELMLAELTFALEVRDGIPTEALVPGPVVEPGPAANAALAAGIALRRFLADEIDHLVLAAPLEPQLGRYTRLLHALDDDLYTPPAE
jgi:hypothetical protein